MFQNATQQNPAKSQVRSAAVRLSAYCLTCFKHWEPLLERLNEAARHESLLVREIRSRPGFRYGRLVPEPTQRPLTEAERQQLAKAMEGPSDQYLIAEEHGEGEIPIKPIAIEDEQKPSKVGSKRRRDDRDLSDATSNSAVP